MNLYEHTIIARQDTSPSEIKQLTDKYSKIIEKNDEIFFIYRPKKGNKKIYDKKVSKESPFRILKNLNLS